MSERRESPPGSPWLGLRVKLNAEVRKAIRLVQSVCNCEMVRVTVMTD